MGQLPRGRKPGQTRNPKGGRPYKREYGEPDEAAQSNFTDPESRIMKTSSEGFQQCYNAQAVVEGENQLVVGAEVTDNASDQGQLVPMVDAVAQAYGETPAQVLADTGYCNERDLEELEERDIDGYVALAREGKAAPTVDKEEYPAKARMAEKLASEDGRRRYARRKWQAEAPIGCTPFRRHDCTRVHPRICRREGSRSSLAPPTHPFRSPDPSQTQVLNLPITRIRLAADGSMTIRLSQLCFCGADS